MPTYYQSIGNQLLLYQTGIVPNSSYNNSCVPYITNTPRCNIQFSKFTYSYSSFIKSAILYNHKKSRQMFFVTLKPTMHLWYKIIVLNYNLSFELTVRANARCPELRGNN